MGEFQEDQHFAYHTDNSVKEDSTNNENKYDISSVYSCKSLDTYLFHRYISRTFEIGKCKRME